MKDFLAEIQDALAIVWADRRTLWARMWLPTLLFAFVLFLILMTLSAAGGGESWASESENRLKMGILDNGNGKELQEQLTLRKDLEFLPLSDLDSVQNQLETGEIDLALVIDEFFDEALQKGETGELLLYYNQNGAVLKDEIVDNLNWYERRMVSQRMEAAGFPPYYNDPVNLSEINAEKFRKGSNSNGFALNEVGVLLLNLIYYFSFLGGIYPALALFTTDATPLRFRPTPNTSLLARIVVVAGFGVLHSLLLFVIFYLLIYQNSTFRGLYRNLAEQAFDLPMMPLALLSLLPSNALIATFLAWSVSRNATFKAAQNRLQPLKFTVFILFFLGLTASFGIQFFTQIIPLLNLGAVGNLLLTHNFNGLSVAVAYVTTFLYAFLCFEQAKKYFSVVKLPPQTDENLDDGREHF